jgi:hypothetical protein
MIRIARLDVRDQISRGGASNVEMREKINGWRRRNDGIVLM